LSHSKTKQPASVTLTETEYGSDASVVWLF